MQDEKFYQRLGACINLAIAGSTDGERASGAAAAKRLLAKLTPAEQRVIMRGLPGAIPPKRVNHKPGTKRAQIVELLDKGLKPKDIAIQLGIRPQYVYRVMHDMRQEG